jgi:hypothetical protein
MRLRSSVDKSPEQDNPDSTPDISPAPLSEHDDKADDRLEALRVKEQDWTNTNREEEEQVVPAQRPTTQCLPVHGSTIAVSQPTMAHEKMDPAAGALGKDIIPHSVAEGHSSKWRQRLRNPWACSPYTMAATLLGFAAIFLMTQSFLTRQLDPKGCAMSYMRPAYSRFDYFDTEHTRFATKYSLYLYREAGLDDDFRVSTLTMLERLS